MAVEINGRHEEKEEEEELKLPHLLSTHRVKQLHATIENEWNSLQLSACQTAAGRALWKHVTNDHVAHLLAGETYLRSLYDKMSKDRINKAREVSGVILAVRTLWFDSKIEDALRSFNGDGMQVVLLGAGMDARAYRLSCLKGCDVFEVDFTEVLKVKTTLLEEAAIDLKTIPNSLNRVAADIRNDDWLEKLKLSGFESHKNTVWVLEGILYYLSPTHALQVLKMIAQNCSITKTVLLADFMNQPCILSNSNFHFHCDWPDNLLPSLGFSSVNLSQIGDPDASFGLVHDPLSMFNKLRSLPRSVQIDPDDGTPCCRLYLVQASGLPNKSIYDRHCIFDTA